MSIILLQIKRKASL